MAERGGPATQSGIRYQNSIAALYMGRSCDSRSRATSQRVVHVHVEDLSHVDDTVVTFADDHKSYIQAKEAISHTDDAWQVLWNDFDHQFRDDTFRKGTDRLVLYAGSTYLGSAHYHLRDLQHACTRAITSPTFGNWWAKRLTKSQRRLIDKIKPLLSPELLSDAALLAFFGHIDVTIRDLEEIESTMVPEWMPSSNVSSLDLFQKLRDFVGGEARNRGFYTPAKIRAQLEDGGSIRLLSLPDITDLHTAIKACSAPLRLHRHTFAATGRSIKHDVVDDIIAWIQHSTEDNRLAVMLDQAGMGKTVVARDVLLGLEENGIPVLAIKADLQLSHVATYDDLTEHLRLPDTVEQVVGRLAARGPVVMLIDQIDALSASFEHDQRALDVVLELVARLQPIRDVRLVLSCRAFDYKNDPRLNRVHSSKTFRLVGLSDNEINAVLQDIGVSLEMLAQPTRELLRIPLHLDLFVRVLEERSSGVAVQGDVLGVRTLQDLYDAVWQTIVLKHERGAPPIDEREEVLRLLTERMNLEQKTTAPQSIFTSSSNSRLTRATRWLASAGILISTGNEWAFLHQTFLDYCYARSFVERKGSLADVVLQGEQGLFVRPQILQVLAYLRGSNPSVYIRELNRLLNDGGLRYHLRDLLLRWFGALFIPTDHEVIVARRLLTQQARRPRLLAAMQGNRDWFACLQGTPLGDLLALDDRTIDAEVIPYLASLVDTSQAEVVSAIHPYVGRNDQWNGRVGRLLSSIHEWQVSEAADLFEHLLRATPTYPLGGMHQIADVTAAYPQVGCRLIRLMLDRILESYLEKQKGEMDRLGESYPYHISGFSLLTELQDLNGGMFHDALERASRSAPRTFVDAVLPWIEAVMRRMHEPRGLRPIYGSDDLSSGWDDTTFGVHHALMHSLIGALSTMARNEFGIFREWAARLAVIAQQTPQQLLARVYRDVPDLYATDALDFLLGDRRRLQLGDLQCYDTARLIAAIYPVLSDQQRDALDDYILADMERPPARSLDELRWQALDKLHLLQAIPDEYLSNRADRALRELKRQFPQVTPITKPIRSISGYVGSPISPDRMQYMSDDDWLGAMQAYHGNVTHQEFLKGGARELAAELQVLIQNDPERFIDLIRRVPDTIDTPYVVAFMNGLTVSNAPAQRLFDVVRRFVIHGKRDVKRVVAWALEKRVEVGLPRDLIEILESYVRGDSDDPYEHDKDPYTGYINSDRGGALNTLMRALDQIGTQEATDRKWELLEFVATHPSSTLRAGAIQELLYVLHEDRGRAIGLFEKLMDGHPSLLRAHPTQDFLYHCIYKHYSRIQPFIRALMEGGDDSGEQRGAELACIAAISPRALSSDEELMEAQALAHTAYTGRPTWRRGAAHVYAVNVADGPSQACADRLLVLVNDDDEAVQRFVSGVFPSLRGEHLTEIRDFIDGYATSRSLHKGVDVFGQYLWEYGWIDPAGALSLTQTVLNTLRSTSTLPFFVGDHFVRLVLRVYADPTNDDDIRRQAMDIFDHALEYNAFAAPLVLREWDQR